MRGMSFIGFFEIAKDLEYLQTDQLDSLVEGVDDLDYYNINALEEIQEYLVRCRDDAGINVTDVLIFCKSMIEEMES
jgi:hypothetical protein